MVGVTSSSLREADRNPSPPLSFFNPAEWTTYSQPLSAVSCSEDHKASPRAGNWDPAVSRSGAGRSSTYTR